VLDLLQLGAGLLVAGGGDRTAKGVERRGYVRGQRPETPPGSARALVDGVGDAARDRAEARPPEADGASGEIPVGLGEALTGDVLEVVAARGRELGPQSLGEVHAAGALEPEEVLERARAALGHRRGDDVRPVVGVVKLRDGTDLRLGAPRVEDLRLEHLDLGAPPLAARRPLAATERPTRLLERLAGAAEERQVAGTGRSLELGDLEDHVLDRG
jgi:hypothetical protein